jgi:hypothetical protein
MKRCAWGLATGLLLLLAARDVRADGVDIVHLQDGGQVRGSIIEEHPETGVRIQLKDGRIRDIPASEIESVEYADDQPASPSPKPAVKPAPAPAPAPDARATLDVTASGSGRVFIDGAERGRYRVGGDPLVATNLPEGRHEVRVDWDEGGSQKINVTAFAGEPTGAFVEMSANRTTFRARRGFHVGLGLSPTVAYVFTGRDETMGGVEGSLYANIGVVPAIDFRFGATTGGIGNDQNWLVPVLFSGAVRFNLGSIYTIELGGAIGAEVFGGVIAEESAHRLEESGNPSFVGGPKLSLAGFRFGESRQWELDLHSSFLIGGISWFESGIGIHYFFNDGVEAPSEEFATAMAY